MPSCVGLRSDYSASELRHVAKKSKDNQSGEEALVAWGRARRAEPCGGPRGLEVWTRPDAPQTPSAVL